jgi:hypothetical protein
MSGIRWPLRAASVEAKPHKGESLQDAIKRVRSEIMAAKGELAQVRSAPPTVEELGKQIITQVMQHAAKPDVVLRDAKLRINWPDVINVGASNSTLGAPSGSTSRMLCWLFPKEVVRGPSSTASIFRRTASAPPSEHHGSATWRRRPCAWSTPRRP